ncbi:MAG: hypothetical protein AMJ54_12425 [Deltaproteobacteria bacterium SG8_13]|nr:MAG: hypothetical protein AMJ54_12425 [Deltaproteobacteria bacterium SG8_13]
MKRDIKEGQLKVYLTNARLLSEEEIRRLPEEKRAAVSAAGKPGLWIEVPCPENACAVEGDKITLPAGEVVGETKGLWLSLFCPEDQCLFQEPTALP